MKPTTVTPVRVEQTAIGGLRVPLPKTVDDARGRVRELLRPSAFASAGIAVPEQWAQVNLTFTARGVCGAHTAKR